MDQKLNKTNEDLAFFKARLAQVQMNPHERLLAEAQLARAEAAVEVAARFMGFCKRWLTTLVARPVRRTTPSAG